MITQEKIRVQFYKWLELKRFIEKEKTEIANEENRLRPFIPENDHDVDYRNKIKNDIGKMVKTLTKKIEEFNHLELELLLNITPNAPRILITNKGKLNHIEIFKKDGSLEFCDTDGN
jgi:hypothetical protein